MKGSQMTKFKADQLVQKHKTFYRKEITPKGCKAKIFVYNYLLSDKVAFADPEARELRGLTIVKENIDEHVFLSIPKFFNINELPETQEHIIRTKTIKNVRDKLDGSMIQPIEVCGELMMKSKQTFDSPQAKAAQDIVDSDEEIHFFIRDCWANNFFPMFELVSPDNKIVLDYPKTELVLIAVRSQEGYFIDIDKFEYPNRAKAFNMTLAELISSAKTDKDKEGYVVKFTDESIIKIKTVDYVTKHRTVSEADQMKVVFEKILTETIDDIYPLLSEKRAQEIQEIEQLLETYVVHYIKQIEDIIEPGDQGNRAGFVKKHLSHIYFSVIMQCIKGYEVKETLIKAMLKKYNKEEKVKAFLKELQL